MRRPILGLVAGLAAMMLVAGCAGSGYHYVKSSEDKTYFKVPDRWTLFDEQDVADYLQADLTPSEREELLDNSWQVAFDASPRPTMKHVVRVLANHPVGQATVLPLSFDAADAMSNATLRNMFVDVDTALDSGTAEIRDYEELKLDGGFRGVHVVADLDVDGRSLTIDQIALVDQGTTKVYGLLVSCWSDCYEKYHDDIGTVVDSWTVRDR